MKFWEGSDTVYKKRVLIVPNYTYFGPKKNINADSFVLVVRSFFENTEHNDTEFLIPYPDGYVPSSLVKFPNVRLINMGDVSSFPPVMRTQFPTRFFNNIMAREDIDVIWSHLPEWTSQLLIVRRYSRVTQKVFGYCHWWEIPENGGYQHNSFINNVAGMLKMETCGVNSEWVKQMVLKRAADHFNEKELANLDRIIQPWYLGTEPWKEGKVEPKTILFNHRDNPYTGSKWFFQEMDKLWETRKDFTVLTSISSIERPYIKSIRAVDRDKYLHNVGSADIGVGCFGKYSAWSMSTTDGLSMNVPYLLPKNLCYEEMVGEDYPWLYEGKAEFMKFIVDYLDGKIERLNTKKITERLYWKNSLKHWKIL